MKLTYLGHSSFLLETAGGTRAVTDPYRDIGYPFPSVEADVVTVSHGHFDHSASSLVRGRPLVLSRAEETVVGDLKISAYPSYHDDAMGKKRGNNLIFVFEADGVTLCHLGDIGEPFAPGFVRRLPKIDVLLIPVGGNYTIDAREARKYVEAISPAVAVPMHFKTPHLTIDISSVRPFLDLFGGKVTKVGGSVSLTDLPDPTRIYFMENSYDFQ